MKRTIAIIGGGLAGIAAAMRLVRTEHRPILIESKKRLGGRATSLVDPRTGHTIDNCQHVLLGCCTNLLDLYDHLRVLDQIQWHNTLYWTRGFRRSGGGGDGGGQICEMKPGWLPAPFHLSRSFSRMSIFTKADKRHIARAMWRMIRMGGKGRLAWTGKTFGDFLRECGQPAELIRSFWNTIIVSACNMDVDRVAAVYALQVFQDGLLASKWSYTMGVPDVPLGELYASAIDSIIEAGGDIQLGCSAKAIGFDGKRATGVITEDGFIESAAVISAVPPDRLAKLTSETMSRADRRLQKLDEFDASPILGVHLRFDQMVMDLPHLVVVDRGVQWLFNKGVGADGNQHVHAVISGADEWMALDEDEIVRRVLEDVHATLPRSVGLQPVDARAIKEKRATFAAVPGVDAIRPSAAAAHAGGNGIDNLFLAGDWTDTGWPATMEGAVRSGYAAAAAAIGDESGGLVEDVPAGWLSRMLGLRS